MTQHEFIFSNKLSHRVTRHLAFWIAFGLVFTVLNVADPLGGYFNEAAVIRVLHSDLYNLPFCIICVYIFSNFLFPVFLKKKKYAKFISGFILVAALGVWIEYYAAVFYFKAISVNILTFEEKIMIGNTRVWCALVAGGFVLGFKLSRNWYQQKNENLLLAKKKATTELKLLKARIHPDFLFKTLDDIYNKINSGSGKSPLLILKLSEMLSYLLYESNHELVPLEKELTTVTNFISLSKLTMPDRSFGLKISGSHDDKFMPPLLLLTLVQNSFAVMFTDNKDCQKTMITISVEDYLLTLAISLHLDKKDDNYLNNFKAFVQSEQRRINSLFPENDYILRLSNQENKVELSQFISLNKTDISTNRNPAKKELYETA